MHSAHRGTSPRATKWSILLAMLTLAFISVCAVCVRYHPQWPEGKVTTRPADSGAVEKSYVLDAGSKASYTQRIENGRVTALLFDDNGDGVPDETVSLLSDHPDWPHFLIILDGVPFDVVEATYNEGHFRLFPPPVRVVSVFPAMTDVALSRVFHTKPCFGGEAQYFDRAKNRLSDGDSVYLSGKNAPWLPFVDYAAPQSVAIRTYIDPLSVFSEELRGMQTLFEKADAPQASGYSIGTAGLGTRGGEKAMREYLVEVEKLVERITYERRGRVRFSLTADHGQTMQQETPITFDKPLEDAGFKLTSSIHGKNDVVVVTYGIVTLVALSTDRPEAVADALVAAPGADLVTYKEQDGVIVRNAEASAIVRKSGDGYVYEPTKGDPLELNPIIERLRAAGQVSADGVIADRPLLAATATHKYPDPLHRLWDCYHGLVQNQADVIVSLKPDACHGRKLFYLVVNPVASTHGGLDYRGSVTYLLSTAKSTPLPAVMRSEDVLDAIGWELKADNAAVEQQ
ncbi:MAG TPA: hypothetical protein VMV94_20040 [Phycisphaerae bacterium]|nr:hypothetical protein [Phycisphaerae bacterium]